MKDKSYEQLKRSVQIHTIFSILVIIALAWVGMSNIAFSRDYKKMSADYELLQLQNKMLIYALEQEHKKVMIEKKKFKEAACLSRIEKFDKIFEIKG
jgi:hypothetical protein